MTSVRADPFVDGSPPNAFHPTEDESYESYEDLISTQPQLDSHDLPMLDLGDESSIPSPSHAPNHGTELESQSEDESMDLPDLETLFHTSNEKAVDWGITKARKQTVNGKAALTESDRIRSLLASDLEKQEEVASASDSASPSKSPGQAPTSKKVTIKQESPPFMEVMSRFMPAEVIDLCDTDDVVIKKEVGDESFNWSSMEDEIISISDSDDDVVVKKEVGDEPFNWSSTGDGIISILDSDDEDQAVLDHETITPATLFNARQNPGMANVYGDEIDELGSKHEQGSALIPRLGTSLLGKKINPRPKPTLEDIAKHRQQQRAFKEMLLGRSGTSGTAGLCKGLDGLRGPDLDGDDINDDSWMNSDTNFDEEAAVKFRHLKRSYKAKQKADTNTIEDDYEFRRAEKTEKARLKRLELEYITSRGPASEEEESDEDGLFVGQSPARRAKRGYAVTGEDDGGSNTQGRKKRRQASDDLEKDLEMNLRAGIDGYFQRERREANREKDSEKSKKGGKVGKGVSKTGKSKAQSNANSKKTWAKKDKAPRKKRPTQAGYLNNASSLLNSNVFETANANRNLAPLPISTATKKAQALADMVANVPLGNRRRAGAEKEHIRRATVTLGSKRVNPDGKGAWKFTGMDSSLHHHQVQGAAWMKERELGDSEPLGGLLADGMGLGKTVMSLSLMVANPPTRKEKYTATLIVCTPALVAQWEKEIGKHVTKGVFRRVMKHRAGERLSGLGAIEDMQKADIVLTTYQEVMRSYPKTDVPENVDNFETLQAWWKTVWDEDRDILHKARFYRIILDESQAIKNHLSQTSIACRALMGKHRWALSGTPIMNKIEELYPYFKYLRVECTGSYTEFTERFCVEGSTDCNKRLHCILDQIMIRRTMDDKILDHPIVKLPTTHQGTERLAFNVVERLIYQIVSRRFIRAINKASAKGELDKKPGYGLVMFLRLRQMTAHIFLIQDILQEMFSMDSVDRLEAAAITGEGNKPARDIIAALRRMVAAKGQTMESTPDRQSADREAEAPSELVVKFGQRLRGLKENSKLEELRNEQLCQSCQSVPEEPWVTSCLHVYCKECLEFLAYAASKKGQDSTPCIKCGTHFTTSKPCSGLKELVIDDFSDLSADIRGRKPKGGKVNMHWVAYDDELVLSAKTIGVENQIKKWLEGDSEKKIIVFSQFLMMLVLSRFTRIAIANNVIVWRSSNESVRRTAGTTAL